MYHLLNLIIFFLLFSCSPASLSELRSEADAEIKKLTLELSAIENKEQLLEALPKLKKRFNKIAHLLVLVRKFEVAEREPSEESEKLFAEMARLYSEIPGGKELIETAQKEALRILSS